MAHTGFIISIEGQDTKKVYSHIRLLSERLKAAGIDACYIASKDSERLSTYYINQYKRGSFGKKQELGPYIPALFYGMDRFASVKRITHKLEQGSVVILDRSLLSDMRSSAHLLEDSAQRLGFYTWLDVFSQQVLDYEKPAYAVYLQNNKPDEMYTEILKLFPKYVDQTLHDSATVTQNIDSIWNEIKHLTETLPTTKPQRKRIEPKLEPLFTQQTQKSLERTIEKYSDQNKHNLLIQPQIMTHASLLLESSLRSSLPDNKDLESLEGYELLLNTDVNGNYKYYTPHQLDSATAQQYEETMNTLFQTIQAAKQALEEQSVTDYSSVFCMLPLAARRNYLARHDITQHVSRINLEEAAQFSKSEIQQNKDNPPKHIQKLLDSLSSGSYSTEGNALKLISYQPQNEVSILPLATFNYSNDSTTDTEADSLDYTQKATVLQYLLKHEGVLSQYSYTFEALLPVLTAHELQEQVGCMLTSQTYIPRHGYAYPDEVEKYEISEYYEKCFDTSYELFSSLQAKGYESLAPYATLLGHKQRYILKLTGSQLIRLFTTTSIELAQIREDIITHLTPLHPHIIESASS